MAIVLLAAALLPHVLGPLAGFFYSLFCDSIQIGGWKGGQSVGKKALGIRAINIHSGQPVSFKESALRNAPVGAATFFAIVPVLGWIILFLVGVPLLVMEV